MPIISSAASASARGYGFTSGAAFIFTITSNQTNANLRTLALNAGWDGGSRVLATIDSGVYISSNSTGTPALTISGSFPAGLELINNGYIVGMGGNGGSGYANGSYALGPGMAGSSGGLALSVSSAVTINNTSGTIAGGGGGGGGGGAAVPCGVPCGPIRFGGAGGGGRSSNAANSTGGYSYGIGYAGSGTVSAAGAGINGLKQNTTGAVADTTGGNGGGWGSSGSNGASPYYAGGAGGAGGGAVSGNSNITWLATGTRLGSIT